MNGMSQVVLSKTKPRIEQLEKTEDHQGTVGFAASFDQGDADIILRSSDNIDFTVCRQFLSFGSPVF